MGRESQGAPNGGGREVCGAKKGEESGRSPPRGCGGNSTSGRYKRDIRGGLWCCIRDHVAISRRSLSVFRRRSGGGVHMYALSSGFLTIVAACYVFSWYRKKNGVSMTWN